jgi:kinesin family protein 11
VHQETVRIVDAQMSDMSKQMEALDDFVAKARSHNGRFHDAQLGSLDAMATNSQQSRTSVQEQLDGLYGRVGQLQEDVDMHTEHLEQATAPLHEEVRQPLSELRDSIQSHPMKEYIPTGVTPKKRKYEYSTDLPRTESHEGIRSRHRTSKQFTALPFSEEAQLAPIPCSPVSSPSKGFVYSDAAEEVGTHPSSSGMNSSNTGLREVDLNVAKQHAHDAEDDTAPATNSETPVPAPSMDLSDTPDHDEPEQPPLKLHRSASSNTPVETKLPQKMLSKRMAGMMEGRENVPPSAIAGGRRYRNRNAE